MSYQSFLRRPGLTEFHRVLYIAAKAKILMKEIADTAKEAPSVMVVGTIVQSLIGVARLGILMAPLRVIFLKISGVQAVHIPSTAMSVSTNLLLVLVALGLIVAGYVLAAVDYYIEAKRRKYADELRKNGNSTKSKNISSFYSIIKSIISFVAIFPIVFYMDPKFTSIILVLIILITPVFIISRRFSAKAQNNDLLDAAINSRTTGAFSIGILVAAALMHIATFEHISHEAAVYFLAYFMLIRQIALSVQRAADGFHKIRL